jgi:hypothetical protein
LEADDNKAAKAAIKAAEAQVKAALAALAGGANANAGAQAAGVATPAVATPAVQANVAQGVAVLPAPIPQAAPLAAAIPQAAPAPATPQAVAVPQAAAVRAAAPVAAAPVAAAPVAAAPVANAAATPAVVLSVPVPLITDPNPGNPGQPRMAVKDAAKIAKGFNAVQALPPVGAGVPAGFRGTPAAAAGLAAGDNGVTTAGGVTACATAQPGALIFGTSSAATQAAVPQHATIASCWMQIDCGVYDVTTYLAKHPGGVQNLLDNCGKIRNSIGFHVIHPKPTLLQKYTTLIVP